MKRAPVLPISVHASSAAAHRVGTPSATIVDLRALPPLFVGTSHIGSAVPLPWTNDREIFTHLDGLVDLGLTAFDLAASYQAGGTERLFGAWLRARKHRSRLYLATKGGHPLPIVAPHRLGHAALEADLNASLKRLGTDQVDLYFLHRDDGKTPLPAIAESLVRFRSQGKIRAWGVSNWTPERLTALEREGQELGLGAPLMTSPQYSLFAWTRPPWSGCVSLTDDAQGEAFMEERGLAVLAWSPLATGYLSGKQSRGPYQSPANEARRQRLVAWAREHEMTAEAALLSLLKASPFPVFPSVASRSLDRMRANLLACQSPMSQDDARRVRTGS